MILVDDRAGSGPFVKLLGDAGLPCAPVRLAFGDFAFEGNGPNGTTLQVGVEYKTLSDLISSIRSGRLTGHQLRGMRDPSYRPATPGIRLTYNLVWLVVEGDWQPDAHGRVCTYKGPRLGWTPVPGRLSASELEKRLIGLEVRAGVYVWHTRTRSATVRYLTYLYRSLTDGRWETHTSHLAPHSPIVEVSEFRDAVMKWPGVGLAVSQAAERRFGSLKRAAMGSVEQWAGLVTVDAKGGKKTFGEAHARKVINFLVKAT